MDAPKSRGSGKLPATMLYVGTSGYSYPEWKGSFYPEKIKSEQMLGYYTERFSTVEINNTFYRLPGKDLIEGWRAAAPAGFRFTLKAPQKITHQARLKDCAELTGVFLERASLLGDARGALLFQLPPNLKKDVARLKDFLALLPDGARAAFEFRNATWHDDAVYALLRDKDAALCIADSEKLTTPFVATASFGYLRLRDEGYEEADIARFYASIQEHGEGWSDTFVYFKHEEAGKGPAFARMLIAVASGTVPG